MNDPKLTTSPALAAAYRDALALAGLAARVVDATAMTRGGLVAAHGLLVTEGEGR